MQGGERRKLMRYSYFINHYTKNAIPPIKNPFNKDELQTNYIDYTLFCSCTFYRINQENKPCVVRDINAGN